MTESIFRGPLVSLGPLTGNVATQAGSQVAINDPYDGPSLLYSGMMVPDVRFAPGNKDSMKSARVPGYLVDGPVTVVSRIAQTHATGAIAAAANTVTSTAMTLVTIASGNATAGVGSPAQVLLQPMAGATSQSFPNPATAVTVLALDFGFTTGTLTAGNLTIVVPDSSVFTPGQWIVIGGGANSAKTASLITYVTGITDATHITVFNAPASNLTGAPIGSGNAWGVYPAQLTATSVAPYFNGGFGALFSIGEGLARGVVITCNNSSGAGGIFTVRGYDVYGMPMTEAITSAPGGSLSAYGVKAFKYIASVTPNFTDATYTYAVGTSDVFGINLRAALWEDLMVSWDATLMTATQGYTAPLAIATAATSTNADVRGTIQTSAFGGGTGIGSNASNNARRIMIRIFLSRYMLVMANPNNPAPMFGNTQA